jgi:mono/diheme cytochrome c family protein
MDATKWLGWLAPCGFAFLFGCGWNGGTARDAVTLSPAPPPVRGGTIAVASDGAWFVVVDRDRNRIDRIERGNEGLVRTASLRLAMRPERALAVDDETWLVRADGQLMLLDDSLATLAEASVCSSAYGLAWDAEHARAWVSCTTGELVIVERTSGGLAVRNRLALGPDTGDIAIAAGRAFVAQTRLARVAILDTTTLAVVHQVALTVSTTVHPEGTRRDMPRAALRLVARGTGVVVLHQRARLGPPVQSRVAGAYTTHERSGPCGALAVQVAVTEIDAEGRVGPSNTLQGLTYASDLAWSASALSVASPSSFIDGDRRGARSAAHEAHDGCLAPLSLDIEGQVTAVAWLEPQGGHAGSFVWQTREPASIVALGQSLELDTRSARDTGHDIFHVGDDDRVPCIACHLDGGDDGHVWESTPGVPRRTTSLRLRTPLSGGVASTAPFHWDGSLGDVDTLMALHFPGPNGTTLRRDQVDAFAAWADTLRARPGAPVSDHDAVARGRTLFESLGCSSCHGALGVAPQNLEPGRGWQVPSLVELSERAPYGHGGCGDTLASMLTERCGGPVHRVNSSSDVADLAAYLGVTSE